GKKKELDISGRVLDADGKPLAAVEVAVAVSWRPADRRSGPRHELLAAGKTDAEGRFRLRQPVAPGEELYQANVVARAKGLGLGALRLRPFELRREVTFRLQPEQPVPVRLVDLQGLPAAGVKGRVVGLLPDAGQLPLDARDPRGRLQAQLQGRFEVELLGE